MYVLSLGLLELLGVLGLVVLSTSSSFPGLCPGPRPGLRSGRRLGKAQAHTQARLPRPMVQALGPGQHLRPSQGLLGVRGFIDFSCPGLHPGLRGTSRPRLSLSSRPRPSWLIDPGRRPGPGCRPGTGHCPGPGYRPGSGHQGQHRPGVAQA